jgi:hypothetical protein
MIDWKYTRNKKPHRQLTKANRWGTFNHKNFHKDAQTNAQFQINRPATGRTTIGSGSGAN